jgi:hypothetical protein
MIVLVLTISLLALTTRQTANFKNQFFGKNDLKYYFYYLKKYFYYLKLHISIVPAT